MRVGMLIWRYCSELGQQGKYHVPARRRGTRGQVVKQIKLIATTATATATATTNAITKAAIAASATSHTSAAVGATSQTSAAVDADTRLLRELRTAA